MIRDVCLPHLPIIAGNSNPGGTICISSICLRMCSQLMLAQAQLCFYEKGENKKQYYPPLVAASRWQPPLIDTNLLSQLSRTERLGR